MQFTTWQRAMCIQVVGQMEGSVSLLRLANKVLDKVEFTEEEKEKINLVATGIGMTWKGEDVWDIELSEDEERLLSSAVSNFHNWSVANRREVFDLLDKLNIGG